MRRWEDLACDAGVAAFAVWTLLANATVALGGSLRGVVLGALGAAVVGSGLWAWRGRAQPDAPAPRTSPVEPPGVPPARLRGAAFGMAAIVVALHAATRDPRVLSAGGLALCAALAARELRAGAPAAPAPARRLGPLLLGVALACVAVTLAAHRPDADDSFLLDLAASAADRPGDPLFARDTLHGLSGPPAGVPAAQPTYRLHAFELLAGALAWLTPLRAIEAAHLLLPALAAFLLPLAWARLLRLLVPAHWPWALLLALGFLLCIGETHLSYGSFGVVRLHQGKAVFVSVAVPLVAASALELALAPGAARWLRLAAVQIASVGLTASALWAGPAVAGLALASALPLSRAGLRVLLAGIAASAYPLLAGAWLAGRAGAALAAYPLRHDPESLAELALKLVLGSGPAASVVLLFVLGGWSLADTPLARRFAVSFALGFLLLWNPWLAPWLAEHVTGAPTYWRVFWILPAPALFAVAASAPLALARDGAPRWLGPALCAAVAGVTLLAAPVFSTLSERNRVRLAWPGLKVPPDAYAAAAAIARHAPAGAAVLAPAPVAPWIPTFHAHPAPLVVRADYLLSLRGRLGAAEVARRGRLANLVGGEVDEPAAVALLERALREDRLAAVCLDARAPLAPALRGVLERAGLARVESAGRFEVWALSRDRRP